MRDMTSRTLPEELFLLALDDEDGKLHSGDAVVLGLAGAELTELALADRIAFEDKKIVVTDAKPVGDAALDSALAGLVEKGEPVKPSSWLNKAKKHTRDTYADRLSNAGVIEENSKKVLGLIPVHRFPVKDAAAKAEIKARLDKVVLGGADGDDRTAALGALLHACKLGRHVYPGGDGSDARSRLKELASDDAAAKGVSQALAAINAAVTATVVAAVVSSQAASGQ